MYTLRVFDEIHHDQAWQQGLDLLRAGRQTDQQDEFWLANIEACYTAGRDITTELPKEIQGLPVVRAPRAGGWTYYNTGQLHVCTVFNHQRQQLSIAEFNLRVMSSVTATLNAQFAPRFQYDVDDAGIYDIEGTKVGSLGFHAHSGWIIGGLVLNFSVDLRPYAHIDVCGVHNRPMGNILRRPAQWSELVNHGRVIIASLTQELYHENTDHQGI